MNEIIAALRKQADEFDAIAKAKHSEAEKLKAAYLAAREAYGTPLGEARQAEALKRTCEQAIQDIETNMQFGMTSVLRGKEP